MKEKEPQLSDVQQKKAADSTFIEVHCPFCRATFKRSDSRQKKNPLLFCAYCGTRFKEAIPEKSLSTKLGKSLFTIREHMPKKEEIQGSIGQYLLLSSIAKGGMGEVFLAFDTISGRRVALKRIRPDFASTPLLKQRFLKEARITSQLIHPSIIPIYNIHIEGDLIYYTMPFVQGTTLRELLKQACQKEDTNQNPTSITAFVRIFLAIAQAIAYAHSRGILHRDIKPENIIVGSYGQVIILDWGLTKPITECEETLPDIDIYTNKLKNLNLAKSTLEIQDHRNSPRYSQGDGAGLVARDVSEGKTNSSTCLGIDTVHTKVGKLVGTVAYMAPERAEGKPSTIQTDIYSLGVILYQILTLTLPFRRKNIDSFLSNVKYEQLVPPEVRAPYRDIPKALSELARKCLETDPTKRVASCDEIVQHLENFLEGKSEWFFVTSLHVDKTDDWQIQENVLFSNSTSPLKRHEISDWYRLMISSQLFADNVRVTLSVTLHTGSQGIGLLLAVPGEKERQSLTDGYCLWLSTKRDSEHGTMLLRSSVLVAEAPNVSLRPEKQYSIVVEMINESIALFIDGKEVFRHISHIPVVGPHIGIMIKDGLFTISPLDVFSGSQNIMVNCLSVPDAFLTAHAYEKAYSSYIRLAELFPGRAEEREAIFRAGISLLENGKQQSDPKERDLLFNKALTLFQKLRDTSGAPLEYLGKSFIYQASREYIEEAKCFEIAFKRYPNHPYLTVLHEQLLVRLHESLKCHRLAASHFIALALRFIPQEIALPSTKRLLADIKSEWEWPHYFPEKNPKGESNTKHEGKEYMLLALSFWLQLPHIAMERLDTFLSTPILPKKLIETALLTIKASNHDSLCQKAIEKCTTALSIDEVKQYEELFNLLTEPLDRSLMYWSQQVQSTDDIGSLSIRALIVLLDRALEEERTIPHRILKALREKNINVASLLARIIEIHIHENLYTEAFKLFSTIEIKEKIHEKSPLFFLKGCCIAKETGEVPAIEFFNSAKECLYPPCWSLAAYVLSGKIQLRPTGWILRAYPCEIATLRRHLQVFARFTSPTFKIPQLPVQFF